MSAFFMDKFDVTAEEYTACVKKGECSAPGTGESCNYGVTARQKDPINCVSWEQAATYCESIGKRLPTEAEWEKAARGGADTKWGFGDNEERLDAYAWFGGDSGGSTHPVGMKNPNQYGLYDMAGNVWQWMADWYDAHYYQTSPEQNPQGPHSGRYRSLRGGSWKNHANSSRAALRYWVDPDQSADNIGLRCVVPAVSGFSR
jgi:formylglycine-generating enzyme required for sulfatase activity